MRWWNWKYITNDFVATLLMLYKSRQLLQIQVSVTTASLSRKDLKYEQLDTVLLEFFTKQFISIGLIWRKIENDNFKWFH